jgi:hypothetical protein
MYISLKTDLSENLYNRLTEGVKAHPLASGILSNFAAASGILSNFLNL